METDQNHTVNHSQQQTLSVDQSEAGLSEEPFNSSQQLSSIEISPQYDSDGTDSSTSYDSDVGSIGEDEQEDRVMSLVTDLARTFDRFRCTVDYGGYCAMSRQLQRVLAQWAKDENVADDALTVLLEILRENHCSHLPADAQTLHYIVENVEDDIIENESEE